jgi:hypothetical protein
MDGKNNVENVRRPSDGKINSRDDFPFRAGQPEAADPSALGQRIEEAIQGGGRIEDRSVTDLYNGIEGRSTTAEILKQDAALAQQLAEHPEILSEAAQSQLMDIPRTLAAHRNADYAIQNESKEIVLKAATHTFAFSDEAQKKLIDNANHFARGNPRWAIDILENISNANRDPQGGINLENAADYGSEDTDAIAKPAQNPRTRLLEKSSLIHLLGNTASQLHSVNAENQVRFQETAIKMMQSTQFPQKFDADALREALFAVPENLRTNKYQEQLDAFDKKLAAAVPPAIVIPEEDLGEQQPEKAEPQPTAAAEDSSDEQPQVPVEGQLPYVILENARPKSPTSQAENLEEDLTPDEDMLTAKAE